jgi:hypothetical protein
MADDVQTYQDQLANLLKTQFAERPKPLLDPQMLALAEGFLTPGRTGSAWEALGTAAGKYRTAQEQQLQQDQAESARKIQLAQIGLQMAYEKRKEGSWQDILGRLGQEGGAPGQPPGMPPGIPPSEGAQTGAAIPNMTSGVKFTNPLVPSEPQVAPPKQTVVGGPQPSMAPVGAPPPPSYSPEPQIPLQARGPQPANVNEISFGPPVQTMSPLERAKMAYASGMKPAEFLNDLEKRALDETEYRDNGIWNKRTRTFTPIDKGETTKVQIGGNEYNTPTGWATRYYAAEGSGNQDMANYWRGKITGRGTGAVTPGIDRTPSAAAPSAGAAVAAGMPAAAQGVNLTVEQLAAREAERKSNEAVDLDRKKLNLKHESETIPKLRAESQSDLRNQANLRSLVEQNPKAFGTVTGKPGVIPALSTWMASMVASKDPQDTTGIDQLVTQVVGTEADLNARTNAAAIINDILFTLRRQNSGQGQWSNAENDALARTGPGLGNNPAALFKKLDVIKYHGLRVKDQLNFFQDKWLPQNPGKGWHEYSIGKDFHRIEEEYDKKVESVFAPRQQNKPRMIPYTPQ